MCGEVKRRSVGKGKMGNEKVRNSSDEESCFVEWWTLRSIKCERESGFIILWEIFRRVLNFLPYFKKGHNF